MGGCSVPDCKNRGKGLTMFVFPKNPMRSEKWITSVKQCYPHWFPKKYSRICEVHFGESEWLKFRVRLKPDAVPNVFPTMKQVTSAFAPQPKEEDASLSVSHQQAVQSAKSLDRHSLGISQPIPADIVKCEDINSSGMNSRIVPFGICTSGSSSNNKQFVLVHENMTEAIDLISVNRQLQMQVILLSERLMAAELELQRLRGMLL